MLSHPMARVWLRSAHLRHLHSLITPPSLSSPHTPSALLCSQQPKLPKLSFGDGEGTDTDCRERRETSGSDHHGNGVNCQPGTDAMCVTGMRTQMMEDELIIDIQHGS